MSVLQTNDIKNEISKQPKRVIETMSDSQFRKFEGPWGDSRMLGTRNLFCGERLVIDLFEYQQSSPDEEVKIGDEVFTDSHMLGTTVSSRVWRITFDRP